MIVNSQQVNFLSLANSKFQFDQESGRRRTTLWMCYMYLQIIIYLFNYMLIMFL